MKVPDAIATQNMAGQCLTSRRHQRHRSPISTVTFPRSPAAKQRNPFVALHCRAPSCEEVLFGRCRDVIDLNFPGKGAEIRQKRAGRANGLHLVDTMNREELLPRDATGVLVHLLLQPLCRSLPFPAIHTRTLANRIQTMIYDIPPKLLAHDILFHPYRVLKSNRCHGP